MESLLKTSKILLKLCNCNFSQITELDIRLADVGWDFFGGKSRNVWGGVPIPNELIEFAKRYVKTNNTRPSIWTCYDDYLYTKDEQGNWTVTPEKLPQRISATFKCSRNRFSPIVENMSMRIAVALDLPTSYNFLVKYTPELHEKITSHINPPGASEELINQYGIVSIDMLKGYQEETPSKENIDENIPENPQIFNEFDGDQLVSFLDSARFANYFTTSTVNDTLVENWMKSLSQFATYYLPDISQEERDECVSKINSRIARSALLRTFIGDCDFTAYNSGFLFNPKDKTLQYAPNFDYGEAFNALRIAKLEGFHFDKKDLTFILDHQPNYLEMKKFEQEKSIKSLAKTYESSASEENIRFIATHFEADIVEFLKSLNQAVEDNLITEIIFSYTQKNEHGDQLISQEEAEMFDEYLTERANWLSFVVIKDILEAEPDSFIEKITRERIGKHAKFPIEKLQGFVDKKFDSLPSEEREKIKEYSTYSQKLEFLQTSFPKEFESYMTKLGSTIDNFWKKTFSENLIEYFSLEGKDPVVTKDEAKELFVKQFIDKSFERAYKVHSSPIGSPSKNKE